MKQIYIVLFSISLLCGSVFAQGSSSPLDIDALASMIAGELTQTINTGNVTVGSLNDLNSDLLGSHILPANPPPPNNGGSPGWAIFHDLIAGPRYVTITGMRTASTAGAGAGFVIEFFVRSGTALGGQGSSSAGWTSLGTVNVTQGSGGSSGVSELFATPVINLNPGDTVGLAMLFTVAGPRYYGTGTPPFQVFADSFLTLITGEARSAPFTSGGSIFASRGLVGEIHYDEFVPVELASFTANIFNLNDGNAVELNWITATELNNLGFQVERRTAENGWVNIGFVDGHGTTTEAQYYSFIDAGLNAGSYYYRLKQIDFNGTFEFYNLSEAIEIGAVKSFNLLQNYPNPFNPSTTISWQMPVNSFVSLKVYDALGKEVAVLVNEEKPAGTYELEFSANGLPSGVYFYRLQAGDFIETRQMILMK